MLTWLHFQDFVGQSSRRQSDGSIVYDFTAQDAIDYFHNILCPANSSGNLVSGVINMELFVSDDNGNLYPGDPMEHEKRLSAYNEGGTAVGCSWEIRWWYWALYGRMLYPPRQIWPLDGAIWSHYPRNTVCVWEEVPGVKSYTVEVQASYHEEWFPLILAPDIVDLYFAFEFVGAQPGRWRVWGTSSTGTQTEKSPWQHFKYTM